MIDYIDNQNKIFEELEKLYKNNRKKLIKVQEEFQENFEEILELHSLKHKLISSSNLSVNPTKYYHLKSRVKTLHSFKEKLYRKNLGLQISSKLSLTMDNFKDNHTKVKNNIFLFDDIIGIRIVTELKKDCNYAYNLVKDENQYFIDKEIIFNEQELGEQPETMKNGLPIYRIKGVYKKKYGFELQIKSKIDEAWGDMDHSLFYKDYAISPIKNTVQITMNNVGHLLEKIEDLLLGLRNSENNYKEKKEEIDFLNELSGNVFDEIKNKLGDNYDLSNIASSIKFIKEKSKVKSDNSEVKNLSFTFLNYEVKNLISSNYINNRNLNFELLIIETLYWHWKEKADDKKIKLTKTNYDKNLKVFIELLKENLLINTKSIKKLDFLSISKDFVTEITENYSNILENKSIYLDPKSVYKLKIIDTFISDAIYEYSEESEDFNTFNISEILRDIYFKMYLGHDISECIEYLDKNYPELFEYKLLNKFIYDLNSIIQKQLNTYKLEDNEKDLSEVRFVEGLLKKVLEYIKL